MPSSRSSSVSPRDGSPSYTTPYIGVEKIETRKRGSVPIARPTFCPFCGTAYKPQPETAA